MSEQIALADKLRQQRDRFIAFAFAGADLLLEMGEDDTVLFSAGAGEAVYGLADADLQGRKLADFVLPRDRKRFEECLLRLRNSGRLDFTPLSLVSASGAITRMRLAGIRLPQFDTTYHLVLSRQPLVGAGEGEGRESDPKQTFVEMVRQRLNEGNRLGQDYMLTLLEVGINLDRLEPAVAQSYLATVLNALEQCSVRGASAGCLGERHFGLVHDRGVTAAVVRARLDDVAARFADKLGKGGAKLHLATLEMKDAALSEDDIGKALTYILNSFLRSPKEFSIPSLADGARTAIEDTLTRVRNFRKMVRGDQLVFLFQPVVHIRTGAVLQYEAFGRIAHQGGFFLPAQIVPFATDVGIIGEFDLLACKKALATMKEGVEISPQAHVAVNMSGESLANPAFYQSLIKVLEENGSLLDRLIIEVADTEKIYNLEEARRLMLRIRRMGVRIALDDFGTGGRAFELLRVLPADYAKLDPSFIVNARDAKGRAVLKAMATCCHEMGVIVIGECIEDAEMLRLLRDIGVDYAQGYYFSAPKADGAKSIRYFTEQVQAAGTAEPGQASRVG